MFNFGWGELVVIGIVALIAIGPKELPTVLRTLGQAMGKIRRMANEFQGQFQEALREAEIADIKKQADEMMSSVNTDMTDLTKFDPLADTQKELEKGFDMAEPATSADTGAAPAEPAEAVPAADTASAAADKPAPPIDVPPPDELHSEGEKDFAEAAPGKEAGGKA